MFYGQRNNNNNGVNVNTKLYSSYSDTAMITLGGWNLQLSLKVHPFKGVNADGIRQYAQDNTEIISTSITTDNAGALLAGIKDKIKPAIENKQTDSVSITMGSNENRKIVTVKTDGTDVFLSVAINVAENGTSTEANTINHKFNKKSYLENYDNNTGSGNEVVVMVDFENFIKKLESIYDFAPTVSHSINYNNAVKASFSNQQNSGGNQSSIQSGYQAPSSNYSGSDMSAFIPSN